MKIRHLTFLFALVAILSIGFVTAAAPVPIQGPTPTPQGDCPTVTCPLNLWGWSSAGTCDRPHSPDCTERCKVYRNNQTGQLCVRSSECYIL